MKCQALTRIQSIFFLLDLAGEFKSRLLYFIFFIFSYPRDKKWSSLTII